MLVLRLKNIFLYLTNSKSTVFLILFYTHGAFHIFDPSSLQNDSELYEAQTYETYGQLSWNQLQGMGKNWMSKEENVMKELRKVSCNPVICGW